MPPFRFGVQVSELHAADWRERVRRYEELGFDALHFPDHVLEETQWDPLSGMGAVAAATDRMGVATSVLDLPFYHPVSLARAAATIATVSPGGVDFGIGAGRATDDYAMAGIDGGSARDRIGRLEEAATIIASLWDNERTTFAGEHYTVRDAPSSLTLPLARRPRLMIGGTAPRILHAAGRHADVVSVFARMGAEHLAWAAWAADSTDAAYAEKTGWARAGATEAGRDATRLDLHTVVILTGIGGDDARADVARITGIGADALDDSHLFLCGSPAHARELVQRRREATGINYLMFVHHGADAGFNQLEALAEAVIAPLSGQ
jgi:probable F420-dependent oxidoreductase